VTADLGFVEDVPANGYRWWYVDGLSNDGKHSLTIICFIGSVFSPFYFSARQKGPSAPQDHICMNVVLTGQGPNRWCFTEWDRSQLDQSPDSIGISSSRMSWQGDHLRIDVDETTCPWPRKVRGHVLLRPGAVLDRAIPLDADHQHSWRPIAPMSRVEVSFDDPELNWQGEAYFDSNWGNRALEDDFIGWTWSQATLADQTRIFYDLERRDGSSHAIALEVQAEGTVLEAESPPFQDMAKGFWRMPRHLRSEDSTATRVADTLLDAPFYTRSAVQSQLNGQSVLGTHESLSLDLFRSWWVQGMLPFRSRRG